MKKKKKREFLAIMCNRLSPKVGLKMILTLAVLFTASALSFSQQEEKLITGTVIATSGEILPGVAVVLKGTTTGGITNAEGNYQLQVPSDAQTLVFSFIGLKTAEVEIGNQTVIDVVMEESAVDLEEVVTIAYGVQKKASLTSAVSTIKGEKLTAIPVATLSNALGGRVTGVLVRQNSGEPGYDNSTIRIRGVSTLGNSSPLIIIDGIERTLSRVDPHDVQEITILKDAASVAAYGMRGSNGVILVTTKRGSQSGKMSVKYDFKYGWQSPTVLPEILSSFEWASMKNAAAEYEGSPAVFSDEDLQKFQDGSDPDRYANSNVYDEFLETGSLNQHNLSVSGGSEKVSYYGSIGFVNHEGIWGDVTSTKRYNYRSNVDIQASKSTKIGVDMAGSYRDATYPASGSASHILFGFYRLNPTNPIFYSGGEPAGYFERNPYLDLYESGYTDEDYYQQYINLKLEQDLTFIDGLKLRANLSIDKNEFFWKRWRTPYTFYQLENDGSLISGTGNVVAPTLDESIESRRTITPQVMLEYNKNWGNHRVNLLGIFEPRMQQWQNTSAGRQAYELWVDELDMGNANPADRFNGGSSGQATQVGYAYRAGYSYDGKYIVEAAGRYDGHYYFAPGNRYAFFPSFSAAWRISDESFMDGVGAIDNFKIRGSWGKSGNLAGGPFQYLRKYNARSGTSYLLGGTAVSSIYESIDPNTEITWEKATKYDIGFDLNMYHGLLNLEADYFYEKREDMLINSTVIVPSEYGIGIGQENNGVMENRGFEFMLSSNYQINNDLKIYGSINFTQARNKILEIAEPDNIKEDPERSRTGKPLNVLFGYEAQGYFNTQEEIDATPYAVTLGLKPGDLKYWDRNGDDQLNSLDYVQIGDPLFPEIVYGLNLGIAFKNFTLDMLWQGASNTSFYLRGWASQAFNQSNGVAFKHHLDYWTPDNTNAEFPLSSNPQGYNYWTSSHWVRDGSYIRLKTLTLAYDFKFKLPWLSNIRIYASGENLLTFTAIDYWDPESPSSTDYYPQMRTVSVGATVDF